MKKTVLLAMCLSASLLFSCSADEESNPEYTGQEPGTTTRVSIEDAINAVDDLLEFLDKQATRGNYGKRTVANYYLLSENKATRSSDSEEGEEPLFYLINFENDQGFAIVGADTRLPTDVFAISDSGNIDPEEGVEDDPGISMFLAALNNFNKRIDLYDGPGGGKPSPTYTYKYSSWENRTYPSRKSGVRWNQGEPYNQFAPLKNGQRCVAGCVPIAVVQLMSCWEHPTEFNGYRFNWPLMKDSETADTDTEAGEMIARLVQQVSRKENLDPDYGLINTSADPSRIRRTLKRTFSSQGNLSNYKSEVINTELSSRFPVIARGNSHKKSVLGINTYTGGHSWLIEELLERTRTKYTYYDGKLISTTTETEHLVFCNWGWNMKEGYYYHKVFDTNAGPVTTRSDERNNYKYNFEMHTGVRR